MRWKNTICKFKVAVLRGIRSAATTILLSCTVLIGELHNFWSDNAQVQNWIVANPRPMLIAWNVKYLTNQITPILYFLAWILYRANRVNLTTIKCFLVFSVFDTILYFYNFKTYGYGGVYVWLIAIWAAMYNFRRWDKHLSKILLP